MSRHQKDLQRPLSEEEQNMLKHLSCSKSQPAVHVNHARALLAVASGQSYTEAGKRSGYQVGDTVGKPVSRFHKEMRNLFLP